MDKISISSIGKFKICDSVTTNSGEKVVPIYGPLSAEESRSQKGYRYREGFWSRVLDNDKVKNTIASHKMLGMIEHPDDDMEYMNTPYDKASHLVHKVEFRGNCPYGTLWLINNQYGNSIKALVDLDVPIGVSTRGLGQILNDSVSDYVDEDNYALITWDITRNPNLESAVLSKVTDSVLQSPVYKEFVQAYGLRDSASFDYNPKKLLEQMERMRKELDGMINVISRTI